MIRIDPPTPAQYAKSCQKIPSTAISPVGVTVYIPIQPATRGTLSTILDKTPMSPVTIKWFPADTSLSQIPRFSSTLISSKHATAIKIPKKNRIVDISI